MKYEYTVVNVSVKQGELEKTLNRMAAEGWRLVPISTWGWTLVFERQVQA